MQSSKKVSLAESPIWHGNNVYIGRFYEEASDAYGKRLQFLIPDDDKEFKNRFLQVCKLSDKQKQEIRRYLLIERYGIQVAQCESCQGLEVLCRVHYSERRCGSCIAAHRDCSYRETWADPRSPLFSTTIEVAPSNLAGQDSERQRDLLGCNGPAKAIQATQQIQAELLAKKLQEVAEGMKSFQIAISNKNAEVVPSTKAPVPGPSYHGAGLYDPNAQPVANPAGTRIIVGYENFSYVTVAPERVPQGTRSQTRSQNMKSAKS